MKSETKKTGSENFLKITCIMNGFAGPKSLYSGLMGADGKSNYSPVAPRHARINWKPYAVIATHSADVETMDAMQCGTRILSGCLGLNTYRKCRGLESDDCVSLMRSHSCEAWQHDGDQSGGDMEGCSDPAKASGEGGVLRRVWQPQAQNRVWRLSDACLLRPLGPRPWLQKEPDASDEFDADYEWESLYGLAM